MVTKPSQKYTIFSSSDKSLVKDVRTTLTQYHVDTANIDLIELGLGKVLGGDENFSQ